MDCLDQTIDVCDPGLIPKVLFLGGQKNVADQTMHWRLESASHNVVIFDHSCELRLKLNPRSPDAESFFGCCAVLCDIMCFSRSY